MKNTLIVLLSLFCINSYAQEIPEKEINSEVNEVTVFLEGAQVIREKQIELKAGKHLLKYVGLSPFIEGKSVQVKAENQLVVLSVNHQQNYLDKTKRSDRITELHEKLELLKEKEKLEKTHLSIIIKELTFLDANRNLGGKNNTLDVTTLKQAADYYRQRLTSLKMEELKRKQTLSAIEEEMNDINSQMRDLASEKEYPSGEVWVKVEAPKTGTYPIEVSYLVGNAGWYPSYDIRAKHIEAPVQLIYKANVKQDTKIDWKDVKLTFSSAEPSVSAVAPKLETYFLDYNSAPPSYSRHITRVHGIITDSQGDPMPGATVLVKGTTIGTNTNIDGHYSIAIPPGSNQLEVSSIGFASQTLPVTNEVMNVALQEEVFALEEVVVTGYGTGKKGLVGAIKNKVSGVAINEAQEPRKKPEQAIIPMEQVENQTTVNFEVQQPYTIKSDNKSFHVEVESYNLPANFEYYCVPKIDQKAYLMAHVTDWERYNLLEGEANVFFEDTYVGKTLLDVRYATDTLQFSLGQDKQVLVKREKVSDFSNKQFIGNKKIESRAWNIFVKNNKKQPIQIMVLDQIPVSTKDEIEVELEKRGGAKFNEKTGELKWQLELKPDEKEEFEFIYSIKYPKYRNLIVE